MGHYLGFLHLARLVSHPNMGDVRGRGLFWAIDFVSDRVSKTPLGASFKVAKRLASTGLEEGYNISLFTASDSAAGWHVSC